MSESGEVIVDFGAGESATVAIGLARENPNSSVVAIGLEGEFAHTDRSHLPANLILQELRGDIRLPFEGGSVDKLFATFILGEVADPVYEEMLGEFLRVIKRGSGRVILCETSGFKPRVLIMAEKAGLKLEEIREGNYPSGSWWAQLFKNVSVNFDLDTFTPTVMEFSSR